MKKPLSVEKYIHMAPKAMQAQLKELRKAILSAAPKAEEKISYGMPYYGHKGRLAYFAYAKKHIGFYIMPKTLEKHKEEVKQFRTGKATLQFSLDKKIPLSLVKKLVKSGVKINEEKT